MAGGVVLFQGGSRRRLAMEERIVYLLQQRLAQKLTPAETQELGEVLHNPVYDSLVTDVLTRLAGDEPQRPAVDEA